MADNLQKDTLNLRKELVLNLKKSLNIDGIKANIVVVMDYSLSMEDEYEDGSVQSAVTRIFPLAMAFDPDGKAPLYLFHNDSMYCGEMTSDNVFQYIEKARSGKRMGGTSFAPVINNVIHDIAKGRITDVVKETKSFFKSLFGSKNDAPVAEVSKSEGIENIPTLVLFFTDGDCSDERESKKAMIDASSHPVFFQFIGIGRGSKFLEELDNMDGRKVDNANYFKMPSLSHPVSDDEFYKLLLNEFPSYITAIKQLNYIK